MIKRKNSIQFIFLFVVVILALCFAFCGGDMNNSASTEKKSAVENEAVPQKASNAEKQSTEVKSSAVPSGWQVISSDKIKIAIPKDWKGDKKTDVWGPPTEDFNRPRPQNSLFMGDMPVMPGTTIEEQIKNRFGGEPENKKDVEMCGLKGFTCEWVNVKYRHIGIFLGEETGAGINVYTFIELQSLVDDFESHRELYEKILSTVECNN